MLPRDILSEFILLMLITPNVVYSESAWRSQNVVRGLGDIHTKNGFENEVTGNEISCISDCETSHNLSPKFSVSALGDL